MQMDFCIEGIWIFFLNKLFESRPMSYLYVCLCGTIVIIYLKTLKSILTKDFYLK